MGQHLYADDAGWVEESQHNLLRADRAVRIRAPAVHGRAVTVQLAGRILRVLICGESEYRKLAHITHSRPSCRRSLPPNATIPEANTTLKGTLRAMFAALGARWTNFSRIGAYLTWRLGRISLCNINYQQRYVSTGCGYGGTAVNSLGSNRRKNSSRNLSAASPSTVSFEKGDTHTPGLS